MKTYLSSLVGLAVLVCMCQGSFAKTSVVGPFLDFQGEVPLDNVDQGLQTLSYHCWVCYTGNPPVAHTMCGYSTDFIMAMGNGNTGTARVVGVAFDTTSSPTRAKPDPDFVVTTMYGLDLSDGGSKISMGGFDATNPELVFHDEELIGVDGSIYLAGPVNVIAMKDVAAFLGKKFDLSFLTGSPDAVVYIFQTVFPHSQQGIVFNMFGLSSAASHLTHDDGSSFDINLPLTGQPGVESRSSAEGNYEIDLTSDMNLTAIANTTASCGTVTSSMIDATNPERVVVNLNAASCNAQDVTVSLDLTNAQGDTFPGASVTLGFLLGDVDGNGRVTKADFNATKAANGQTVDDTNFRKDVNLSGTIDREDATVVREQLGTSLPH
ncbi:MAG TPA: hypothetical protein VGI60_12555 [Chthoniobacterales bacterium]